MSWRDHERYFRGRNRFRPREVQTESVSSPWEAPVNLGPTVNGPDGDGTPDISADGRTLFLRSDRPGGEGGSDLWQVAVTPTSPGDLDGDGDVDLDDFALFAECMAGPDVTTPPPGCDPVDFAASDLEGDTDVDLRDFAGFQLAFGN